MEVEEFWREGYLQELNRQFLHPLGLALEVSQADDGTVTLGGIWDCRDDPEGIIFVDDGPDPEKAKRIEQESSVKALLREAALGYVIQPVGARAVAE